MLSILRRFYLVGILLLVGCDGAEPVPEPKDYLVVLNKAENTASIVDLADGHIVDNVVTGVAPHEAAAHPRSSLVLAANYGTRVNPGSTLTLIDVQSRRADRTISLGRFRRPHGIQIFSGGMRAAVTVEGNQSLIVVNLEDGEIEQVIPTSQEVSHMVVLSPDESRAYVSNLGSGTVSVIDLTESRLVANVETGEGAEGLDISPDGSELWVSNRAENTLAVVDTETLEIVEKMPCEGFPIRVRFTPDGRHVLVSNARTGDVAVFSREDRVETRRIPMELTAVEKEDRLLQFDLSPVPIGIITDPEGKQAYVANANADIVTVIDLTTWEISGRLHAGEEPDGMAYVRIFPPQPESP